MPLPERESPGFSHGEEVNLVGQTAVWRGGAVALLVSNVQVPLALLGIGGCRARPPGYR